MKQIFLKSLDMQNFKGCQNQHTEIPSRYSTIKGRNASGKSRHFDAFLWCLFGKDSQDRKDYEIKSRDLEGKQVQKVEVSVTATLVIDGQETTITRSYVEDWVKPRGQKEQVLKKHHTECSYNGVPLSVGEFSAKITEIIEDGLFKMITNPLYFAGMDWKKQREMLFNIAGTITEQEMGDFNQGYKELLASITGKSVEEYRKEIASRKKHAKDEIDKIPTRIDQTYRMMPKAKDWTLIEKQIQDCDEETEKIHAQMQNKDAAMAVILAANSKKRAKITELENSKASIISQHRIKQEEERQMKNAGRNQIVSEIGNTKMTLRAAEMMRDKTTASLNDWENERESLLKQMDALRKEWSAKYKEPYQEGSTICPHCGQQIPEEMREQARRNWEADKQSKLDEMTAKGKAMAEKAENIRKNRIVTLSADLETADAEINKLKDSIQKLEKQLADTPEFTAGKFEESQVPGVEELEKEIQKVKATIIDTSQSTATESSLDKQLAAELKALKERRDALTGILSDREKCKNATKEIKELEQKSRELSSEIAEIERKEDTIDEMTKERIRECEARVNSRFKMVSWKLFEHTMEGGEFEVCIPMVEGVPFQSANTAAKVQAGLEIIGVLQEFFNVKAPIFIDNRESIQMVPHMEGTQIINLKVEDCDLEIEPGI